MLTLSAIFAVILFTDIATVHCGIAFSSEGYTVLELCRKRVYDDLNCCLNTGFGTATHIKTTRRGTYECLCVMEIYYRGLEAVPNKNINTAQNCSQ